MRKPWSWPAWSLLVTGAVGACKRFMATARQMSPLRNIIPSPAAFESHYRMRVQLPRRQHGHTRRINDFVTYKFQ